MALNLPMHIDLLADTHLDDAFRLSTQVGWNQTRADWQRMLDLNPQSCLGGFVEGRLVGTATLASYGGLAWVGLVIVDEAHRNRGYGSAVFERVLGLAGEAGIHSVGLDATGEGRRLYRKYGFCDVCPIERWTGRLRLSGGPAATRPVTPDDITSLVEYDRGAMCFDRGLFLRRLLSESPARAWLIEESEGLRGYAVVRPGRLLMHLGPLVAESLEGFEALLETAAESLKGEAVLADCLVDGERAGVLEARGLTPQRRLTRMTLGGDPTRAAAPQSFLAAGFEWG